VNVKKDMRRKDGKTINYTVSRMKRAMRLAKGDDMRDERRATGLFVERFELLYVERETTRRLAKMPAPRSTGPR
jgi:hypothetical protein